MFNNYGLGGYLVWHGIKVFIDGRADLYSPLGIFEDYLAVGEGDWKEIFAKYDITLALLEKKGYLPINLAEQGWKNIWMNDKHILLAKGQKWICMRHRPIKGAALHAPDSSLRSE